MENLVFDFILLFCLILFAGFVDAIAGGGGLITIPSYLFIGVPSNFVLGTNKVVSTIGIIFIVLKTRKYFKSINKFFLGFIIFSSLIGSILGAYLSNVLDSTKMIILLTILIPITILLNLFKSIKVKNIKSNKVLKSKKDNFILSFSFFIKAFLICFIIGGYDGFFGPGTGIFLLLSLYIFLSLDFKESWFYAKIVNMSSNLSASLFFIISNKVLYSYVLVAIPACLLGYYLGSLYVIKFSDKALKIFINVTLYLLFIYCIFTILYNF